MDQTNNQPATPVAGDTLSLANGGTIQWTGGSGQYIALSTTPVGGWPGGSALDINEGTFNISQGMAATNGYGLLLYNSSSFTVENASTVNIAGDLSVGQDTNGSASAAFSGSAIIAIGTGSGSNLGLYDGNLDIGTILQSGTASVTTPTFSLGFNSGASGTYQMQGGTLNITANGVAAAIGGAPSPTSGTSGGTAGGSGIFNISAGTVNVSNALQIYNTANTVMNISGTGTLTAGSLIQTGGLLNVSGGTVTVSGTLNSSGGAIDLDGGTIQAGALNTPGLPSSLNWTTGALALTSSNLTIGNSGAIGTSVSLGTGMSLIVAGPTFGLMTNVSGTANISGGLLETGFLSITNGGSVNLSIGTIYAFRGMSISNGGSFNLTGGHIEGSLVNQSGGVFSCSGTVYLNSGGFGGASFNSYSLAGGTLSTGALINAGSVASFNWTSGMLNITGSGSSFGGVLTVPSSGMLKLDGAITNPVVVSPGGVFNLDPNTGTGILVRTLNTISLSGGSIPYAQVNALPAASNANRQLIVTLSLNIAGSTNGWNGTIDLANNDLDIQGGSLATITNQTAEGYNSGNWNGIGGILSTSAAADTTHLTALGVIQNNQSGIALFTASHPFDGTTPGVSDILVKYTYYGDANLSGSIDGSDYSLIDNGYLNHLTGWFNGDFNYDGVVNGSDYTLIDNAFNNQGAQLTADIAGPAAIATTQIQGRTSAVPEPSLVAWLGVISVGLLGRRREFCRR